VRLKNVDGLVPDFLYMASRTLPITILGSAHPPYLIFEECCFCCWDGEGMVVGDGAAANLGGSSVVSHSPVSFLTWGAVVESVVVVFGNSDCVPLVLSIDFSNSSCFRLCGGTYLLGVFFRKCGGMYFLLLPVVVGNGSDFCGCGGGGVGGDDDDGSVMSAALPWE